MFPVHKSCLNTPVERLPIKLTPRANEVAHIRNVHPDIVSVVANWLYWKRCVNLTITLGDAENSFAS